MAPPHASIFHNGALHPSIFHSGIDVLESSIAGANFSGVDSNIREDLVKSTLSAIKSLETLNDDGMARIAIETPPPTPPPYKYARRSPSHLPIEIVIHIISFVPSPHQSTFASACKVSRQWYHAATSFLYAHPRIITGNYEKFIATICPSVTNIKPSPLAEFVKTLDLSRLVYDGRPSYTARLLRRTHNTLRVFIAPQAQFGCSCLVALSHCHELRSLNLELVSQAMGMNDLFQHFKGLRNLRDLKFPRSMLLGAGDAQKMRNTQFDLPAKLECFSLTGGLSDTFMMKLNAPASLNELHISHLSFARQTAINNFLGRIASQLTVLEVNFHIPMLPYNALDKVLVMCPNLVKLSVAVDFVTYHLFDEENTPAGHPLKQLDLDSSGVDGTELKLKSDDLYICLAEDRLQKVRIVRINERLNWMQREEEDVMDLISLLESRVDEKEKAEGALCGVWEFVNNDCRLRW